MLGYLSQIYIVSGQGSQPVGTKHRASCPTGHFRRGTGHVIVACLTEGFWRAFVRCLDLPELIEDTRFAEYGRRLENREALEALIEERMRRDNTAYWLDRLDAFDVPNAPILDVGAALEQPCRRPRSGRDGAPCRGREHAHGARPDPLRPCGACAEHSVEVLAELLGIGQAECRRLIEDGVMAVPQARRQWSRAQ